MVALADTLNISRQTLYNRFESKESVLNWATESLITHLRADAFKCLEDANRPLDAVLLDSFCSWLCPIVKLLRESRHGDEFLGLSAGKAQPTRSDPLVGFTTQISKFLIARKAQIPPGTENDKAYLLVMAAKGLLLTSNSQRSFRTNMARAIRGAGLSDSKSKCNARTNKIKPNKQSNGEHDD